MYKTIRSDRRLAFLFAFSVGFCTISSAAQAFNPQPDPPGKILQGQVLPGETKMFKEVDPAPANGFTTPGSEASAYEGYKPGATKMLKEVDPAPANGFAMPGSEVAAFEGYAPGDGEHSNLVGAGFGGGGKPHIDKKTKPQPTPPCDPLHDGVVLEQFAWGDGGKLGGKTDVDKLSVDNIGNGKLANLSTLGQPQMGGIAAGLNTQVNISPVPSVAPPTQVNVVPQLVPTAEVGTMQVTTPTFAGGGALGRLGR